MKNLVPKYSFANTQLPFAQWQETWRAKLRELLKMPQHQAELQPRSLWKREHALGTIEKIVFTSEPHSDVLAYLCLPRNATPPFTTMICLQGHSSGAHNSIGIWHRARGRRHGTAG